MWSLDTSSVKRRWQKIVICFFFCLLSSIEKKAMMFHRQFLGGKHGGISSRNLSKVNGKWLLHDCADIDRQELTVSRQCARWFLGWQWGIIHDVYKYSSDRLTRSCMSPDDNGFTIRRRKSMENNDIIILFLRENDTSRPARLAWNLASYHSKKNYRCHYP